MQPNLITMDKRCLNNSSKQCNVSGADFCKYYHRPLISNKLANEMHATDEVSGASIDCSHERVSTVLVTRATQTDYRESGSQTDPWDPPYNVTKVLKDPEVLALKNFSYGYGLPASILEVKYISETKKNKSVETDLECFVSEDLLVGRKQVMCDQVQSGWNYKMSVLNQKQLDKLAVMQSDMCADLKKHSDRKTQILTNMWLHRKVKMEQTSQKLEQKLNKELHALEPALVSKKVPKSLQTSDVLKRKVLLPRGEDVIKPRSGTDYVLSNYYLSNPEGLLAVKKCFETKALTTEIPLPIASKRTHREKLAEKAYQDLFGRKHANIPPKVYHQDYLSEEMPVPTVKAEDVLEISDVEKKKIDFTSVWQQVLRGLACQKQMLELIEHHKDALSTILWPLYPEFDDP